MLSYRFQRLLIVIVIASVFNSVASASASMTSAQISEDKFDADDSLWNAAVGFLTRKKDMGKDRILSPIIIPFYTPEHKFGVALGGLLTFNTDQHNTEQPRSTLRANVFASTEDAYGFITRLESFWNNDAIRFNVALGVKDARENYYGIGYDAGFDVNEGIDTTLYDYLTLAVKPSLLWRVKGDWFVGVNADFNYIETDDIAQGMLDDPIYQEFGSEYWSSGIGLTISYDTRDVTANPWSGSLLQFNSTHYFEALGSDNEFDLYVLDYRKYFQLWREGTTLAVRGFGQFSDGDIPWSMYPVAGGSRNLRGYEKGRFRDKTVVTGIMEYRHQFMKGNKTLSPHSVVVWLGYGFLGDDPGDLSGNGLPNAGFGYRLELQDRLNLRLDVGFGDDDEGVYLSVYESF